MIFKPVTFHLADILAHAYMPHQHYKVMHHEDGKDHVHYQINEAAKEDQPQQKGNTAKSENEIIITDRTDNITLCCFSIASVYYDAYTTSLPSVCLRMPAPPPRMIVY